MSSIIKRHLYVLLLIILFMSSDGRYNKGVNSFSYWEPNYAPWWKLSRTTEERKFKDGGQAFSRVHYQDTIKLPVIHWSIVII